MATSYTLHLYGSRVDKEKFKTRERERGEEEASYETQRGRDGAQKHLSSRTRQVFNLRIKTV